MIVVDTSVWIDYVNVLFLLNRFTRQRFGQEPNQTGDLIITDFCKGSGDDRHYFEAKRMMESLEYYDLSVKTLQ